MGAVAGLFFLLEAPFFFVDPLDAALVTRPTPRLLGETFSPSSPPPIIPSGLRIGVACFLGVEVQSLLVGERADDEIDEAVFGADEVIDVIGQGAAQSWQMDNRALTMAEGEFDFGFAVEWMLKDLGICLDEAARNGARLPVTALVSQFYRQVDQRGGARWDTSSLVDLLQNP